MPLYMDRHEAPGATAEDIADAHAQDVGIQHDHGVKYLTYWFDAAAGSVFCLAEGPNREAVEAVHRESHGLLAATIIEVEPGPIQSFFGAIPTHPVGEVYEASAVRAVLFTDMCGSTALTQALGDDVSTALLQEHDTTVRAALAERRGREVKHTGDGIMASFASINDAVQAAVDIQAAMAARNADADTAVELRIGISAGEPVTDKDDLFGAAVQLAARLCAHCAPGAITVSVAVRELCIGKLHQFTDGGMVELKGFAEPIQVYRVSWS